MTGKAIPDIAAFPGGPPGDVQEDNIRSRAPPGAFPMATAAGALDRPTRREGEDRRVTFDAGVARAIDLGRYGGPSWAAHLA